MHTEYQHHIRPTGVKLALIDFYLLMSTSPDKKTEALMDRTKRSAHKRTYLPVIEHTNEIELSKRSLIRHMKFT